jgi:hypothetical protein
MAKPEHLRSLVNAGRYESILVMERVVQELRAARKDSNYHDLATNSLGVLQEAIVSAGGRIRLLTEKGDVVAIEQILPFTDAQMVPDTSKSARHRSSGSRSFQHGSPPRAGKRTTHPKLHSSPKSGSPDSVEIAPLVEWEDPMG